LADRRMVKISGSGHVDIHREPIPPLKAGEILVRVRASLISAGTELGAFQGKARPGTPQGPYRSFGYQNAGEVVEVGEGCKRFSVGQRVACMGAGYALHADYACVPQNMAVGLPDSVADEEGAFAALVPTAMMAARRGEVVFGEEVGVLGLGIVGQLTAQVCQVAGARTLAFDPHPLRAERARSCGITLASAETGEAAVARAHHTTQGGGLDCAFICFGGDATEALKVSVRMMREAPDTHRSGKIVLVGGAQITHRFGSDLGNLDLRSAARTGPGYHDEAYELGADYPAVFVRWTTQAHLHLFVRWMVEGKLHLKELITDRVPVQEAPAACYALMDAPQDHLGVLITYDHPA
jgi:threonine dehydrogenase-like Zn-dependent dehydrogenase